ncbi:MAG: hypothetical protein GY861_00905 [bacterium]|nr:hypothetical protein [bacterium]
MQQQPDELGRIIVSYKLNHKEVGRARSNCKALQIPLNEYMNDGLIMKNNHTENNSPYIDIKARSKMLELVEDIQTRMGREEEKDTHIVFLQKQIEMKDEESKVKDERIAVLEKAGEKVQ